MFTADNIPLPPTYPDSSRTIVQQDTRTRELAEAMVRLNAEGECTVSGLRREGFSAYELEHLADAARTIANGIFVKRLDDSPRQSDEELIRLGAASVAGLIDEGIIVATLREQGFTNANIARLWDRIVVKAVARIAKVAKPELNLGFSS